MNFNDYSKSMLCKVQLFLGSEYESSLLSVKKNNDVDMVGIKAIKSNSKIAPTVYIDSYYNEAITEAEIEYYAMKVASSLKQPEHGCPFDTFMFEDYECVKKQIRVKLINAEMNKELIDDVPHRRFHNLAIVPFFLFDNNDAFGQGTVVIHNNHLSQWGNPSEEELMDIAIHNTLECSEYESIPIEDLIENLCGRKIESEKVGMYVVSNAKRLYGATALLKAEIFKEIADKIDDDLYIIPSSVHEVIAVPVSGNMAKKDLAIMVSKVNRSEVDPTEILSDSVYIYYRESGTVEWAI